MQRRGGEKTAGEEGKMSLEHGALLGKAGLRRVSGARAVWSG